MAILPEQFPNLEALYGQGALSGYLGGQQIDMARRSQQLNQQSALQDLYYNEQVNPIKLRQAGLNADTTEAQLPGFRADSAMRQRKQKVQEGIPITDEIRAEMSKMAANISDDEWKQTFNGLREAAVSPDAAVREKVQMLIPFLLEVQQERAKEKERTNRAMDLERLRQQGALTLEDKRIDAGKYKKSGSGVVSFMDQLNKLKNARDKHAALRLAARQAELDGDTELASKYTEMAEAIRPQAEAEIASQKPGSVDVDAATKGKVPTMPGPQIAPVKPSVDPGPPKLTRQPLSEIDKQALEWANANPTDPRAQKIKNKLGIR